MFRDTSSYGAITTRLLKVHRPSLWPHDVYIHHTEMKSLAQIDHYHRQAVVRFRDLLSVVAASQRQYDSDL